MKTKVLILILPSFFKFSIFPPVLLYNTYGHFSSKFSQKLLDLGLWNLWQFCRFSESVTTSDGYRRGYVSFAHFLLYYESAGYMYINAKWIGLVNQILVYALIDYARSDSSGELAQMSSLNSPPPKKRDSGEGPDQNIGLYI